MYPYLNYYYEFSIMKQKKGMIQGRGLACFLLITTTAKYLKSIQGQFLLVHFVTGCVFATHLDYCIALYAGIIQVSLAHLQLVQNAALYFSTGTYNHNIQPTGI